jgi:hypothetical protein
MPTVQINNFLTIEIWYLHRRTTNTTFTLDDITFNSSSATKLNAKTTSSNLALSSNQNTVFAVWVGVNPPEGESSNSILILNRNGVVLQNLSDGKYAFVSTAPNIWSVQEAGISVLMKDTSIPGWVILLIIVTVGIILIFLMVYILHKF